MLSILRLKVGFITHLAGCPQAKLIHILKVPVLSDTWKYPFLILFSEQNWVVNRKTEYFNIRVSPSEVFCAMYFSVI